MGSYPDNVEIGQKVWIYDDNCRHYVDDNGNPSSTVNYRKSWREYFVIASTSRSWLLGRFIDSKQDNCLTFPRNPFSKLNRHIETRLRRMAWTSEELEEKIWLHNNHWKLADAVKSCFDLNALKHVARLIGYKES